MKLDGALHAQLMSPDGVRNAVQRTIECFDLGLDQGTIPQPRTEPDACSRTEQEVSRSNISVLVIHLRDLGRSTSKQLQ